MPAMIDVFQLMRPVNLLLMTLMLLLIKLGFLEPTGVQTALDIPHYLLLVLATVMIGAAGNLINDLEDQAIDSINKPDRTKRIDKVGSKKVFGWYLALNILGVALAFYISNHLGRPNLTAVFILVSALLYFYSTQLSGMLIVGNVLVSLLVGVCVLLPVLFDIFPAIAEHGGDLLQTRASMILLVFAGFATYINLVREIVKDILDVNGDHKVGRDSIPLVVGRERSRWLVFWLLILLLVSTLALTYFRLYDLQALALFVLFVIGGLLLIMILSIYNSGRDKTLWRTSTILKLLLFVGLLPLLFFPEELLAI